MSQNQLVLPTTGTLSGLQAVQDVNNALDSLCTQNSGGSAPTNAQSGAAELGQTWLNTTASTYPWAVYDGSSTWLTIGVIDPTNHLWTPPVGGGAITTVASASTTDIGGVPQAAVTVSGTTTINSLGSSAKTGQRKLVTFSGSLTITYNATSLILPGAANVVTQGGDVGEFLYLGSGNWNCVDFQRASGAPLAGFTGGMINKFRNGTVDVWQRGPSGTVAAGTTAYTADGWQVIAVGASNTWGQSAAEGLDGNCRYTLSVVGATGCTQTLIQQRIESSLCYPLYSTGAQNITVQAVIYNGTSGTFTPTLNVSHASSADNWSSPTLDISVNLQPCPVATWTRVAYTLSLAVGSINGLQFAFGFNSVLTSGSQNLSIGEIDVRSTPGVAAGLNNAPPSPELRPYPIELLFCQRYFETSYNVGIAPGTAGQGFLGDVQQIAFSTTDFYGYRVSAIQFKGPKRSAPTITLYNPSTGAPGSFYDYTAAATAGNSAAGTSSMNQFGVYCSNSALTAGHVSGTHWTASSEL